MRCALILLLGLLMLPVCHAENTANEPAPTLSNAPLPGKEVALVRTEVAAENGATGRVEVTVYRREAATPQEAGYVVTLRDISPAGVRGAQLPEVEIRRIPGCIHIGKASSAYSNTLPREQAGENSYFFPCAELPPEVALSLDIRTPERTATYPLRLAQMPITLRPPLAPTAPRINTDLAPRVVGEEEAACTARLQPDVPGILSQAPLRVEVYAAGAHYLITARDPSPQQNAAYRIARIECHATEAFSKVTPHCSAAEVDARGLGQYLIRAESPTREDCHDTTFLATVILTDEWDNIIATLPLELPIKADDVETPDIYLHRDSYIY